MKTSISSVASRLRGVTIMVPICVVLIATGARIAAQSSAQSPTQSSSDDAKRREQNLLAGTSEARQMLLLMDRDKSGKVSRQEFMKFMEEEFNLLDKNKDGELDVEELTHSRLVPRGGRHR
jgi:hypothetical protein